MASKKSNVYVAIAKCPEKILEGTLLAIDPSTGSKSSLPGYAIYQEGLLTESGLIDVNINLPRQRKLYEINRTLREEFTKPDVLAIEYIPPFAFKVKGVSRRTGVNNKTIAALNKAIGSIICAWDLPDLIEVAPASWSKYKTEDYVKTDEWDAITIGACVVDVAFQVIEDKKKLKEKETKA